MLCASQGEPSGLLLFNCLQYTTIFSTVNRRVLKFTKEPMNVHETYMILQPRPIKAGQTRRQKDWPVAELSAPKEASGRLYLI